MDPNNQTSGYSDLSVRTFNESVIIVQPDTTFRPAGMIDPYEPTVMADSIKDILSLKFVRHTGSLLCWTESAVRCGEPLEFTPCGSYLKFNPLAGGGKHLQEAKTRVVCQNSLCRIDFDSLLSREQWQDLLLHLMIKQIMPELPCANYVDCSKKERHVANEDLRDVDTIRSLGIVALARDVLKGPGSRGCTDHSLGFSFHPGNSGNPHDFEAWPSWLRLLVVTSYLRKKDEYQLAQMSVMGPKKG